MDTAYPLFCFPTICRHKEARQEARASWRTGVGSAGEQAFQLERSALEPVSLLEQVEKEVRDVRIPLDLGLADGIHEAPVLLVRHSRLPPGLTEAFLHQRTSPDEAEKRVNTHATAPF